MKKQTYLFLILSMLLGCAGMPPFIPQGESQEPVMRGEASNEQGKIDAYLIEISPSFSGLRGGYYALYLEIFTTMSHAPSWRGYTIVRDSGQRVDIKSNMTKFSIAWAFHSDIDSPAIKIYRNVLYARIDIPNYPLLSLMSHHQISSVILHFKEDDIILKLWSLDDLT